MSDRDCLRSNPISYLDPRQIMWVPGKLLRIDAVACVMMKGRGSKIYYNDSRLMLIERSAMCDARLLYYGSIWVQRWDSYILVLVSLAAGSDLPVPPLGSAHSVGFTRGTVVAWHQIKYSSPTKSRFPVPPHCGRSAVWILMPVNQATGLVPRVLSIHQE